MTVSTSDRFPGLTTEEVRQREAAGLVNRTPSRVTRPFATIVAENLFTLFNAILFGMVALLLLVGEYRDAFLIGGLVLFTVLAGIVQETRAKLRLDRIALLAQPHVVVIRNGQRQTIRPGDVVQGDFLVLSRGDQVVADGEAVWAEDLRVNQALLTGEPQPVLRRPGDPILSGSYVVGGSGIYVANRVGSASYVQRLTEAARYFQIQHTPLQLFVDRILRILLVVVVGLSVLQVLAFLVEGTQLVTAVRATAVIATLVPQGLLLMSTVAYSLGALRVAEHGGLVQRLSAVEQLSHVDLLCTDKTGTLTTGKPVLRSVIPLDTPEADARRWLGDYAASTPERDAFLEAIAQAIPRSAGPVLASVPFQFEQRWSSLTLGEPGSPGAYVLGAPEVLLSHLKSDAGEGAAISRAVDERSAAGERVLLFARAPDSVALRGPDGRAHLPSDLHPIALVALAEEIRPDAPATLAAFWNEGVTIKVLSGDNPETVLAIAQRVGFPPDARAIDGAELGQLSDADFARVVRETTVFGRVDPEQKARIIRELRSQGSIVAMIGDGANDILAMKAAQLGIAMASGSAATRGAADVVLLKDTFATLPAMLGAGRKIVNAMYSLVDLFLIRDIGTIELIAVVGFIDLSFPLLPPQVTIAALLTVGIPSLFIVGWATPNRPPAPSLARVAETTIPLGSAVGMSAVLADLIASLVLGLDLPETRTVVVSALVLSGLIALVELMARYEGEGRPWPSTRVVVLAIASFAAYLVALYWPITASLFALAPTSGAAWLATTVSVGASFGGLAILRRSQFGSW